MQTKLASNLSVAKNMLKNNEKLLTPVHLNNEVLGRRDIYTGAACEITLAKAAAAAIAQAVGVVAQSGSLVVGSKIINLALSVSPPDWWELWILLLISTILR